MFLSVRYVWGWIQIAKFQFNVEAVEATLKQISDLPVDVIDEILMAKAEIAVDEQRKSADQLLNQRGYSTGQTRDSIKISNPKYDAKGVRSITVGFSGKRKKGQSAAEVAFVNEFGVPSKKIAPRQFIRVANERAADRMAKAAQEVMDKFIKSTE